MPRYILKLPNGNYLEWSTVVDAPISFGMPRSEFCEFYDDKYGTKAAQEELPERLHRADRHGCSDVDMTLEQCIAGNRAGKSEASLTLDEIMQRYGVAPDFDIS